MTPPSLHWIISTLIRRDVETLLNTAMKSAADWRARCLSGRRRIIAMLAGLRLADVKERFIVAIIIPQAARIESATTLPSSLI
jgi:hypothetical protein